ncbi:DNA cytosine methyltransferase [Haladaptatus sp. QDMS2]|uniref:DNA cytosine methyltransferase n=1 Tax=Haladaptatus sp. QDMS2 TaxID=3033391 RepID=UPI0023E845BE|nr:DNA cytosine methyltransferase [Haladaptatus sp. QDMS2]
MSEKPRAIDLFCGGGGFSEGLRQAGFEITHAVDIDSGAVETHELNHPDTETIKKDIMDLDPEDLPDDVDVLFGSPPCTEFSWAKNGGGGDIEAGMKLVKRFLYFVDELDPDYWVMENVPRLNNYLPETIDFADVPWGEGTHSVDITKVILEGDDYGTPQRRSRLFSGEFPVPEPSEDSVPSFGDINHHFPTPATGIPEGATATDPNYDIELPAKELTDHFYISHVTNREAEEIRVRKEDHSYYGRMSFPDDPEVPSRTVLATNRRVARETLVMEEADEDTPDGISRFRKPTIREIASIQGFPITYQFTGSSQAKKWRRVGDAVPPTMAFRVGCAIREAMGLDVPEKPTINRDTPHPETNLNEKNPSWRGRRRLSISRNFRHHVPVDSKQKFRVDLETDKDSSPPHPFAAQIDQDFTHPVEFGAKLYRGYSTDVVSTQVDFETAAELVEQLIETQPEQADTVHQVVSGFLTRLGPVTPDATTLQAIRSRRADRDEPLEFTLLSTISSYDGDGIVDEALPKDVAEGIDPLTVPDLFDDATELPVRVLLKLVGATYLAEKLNRCSKWLLANPEEAFIPEDFSVDRSEIEFTGLECQRTYCIDSEMERLLIDSQTGENAVSASTD